ncbi:HER052Wp [Eremothecium sinecaudum]|uniref:HER052Wp n=1 Tax=Eremothecium sinecaudum TaxID=45286 RepID=A0A109UZI4_9SACH|nr:HER052Wp [Eremothecium sinecaudum]AMD21331.1 HER052Wp [Eremothecium sinecaudum]
MVTEKRLSLPQRSILKQKSNYNDEDGTSDSLQISSQMQFSMHGLTKEQLLGGNNTTSRINTAQLQSKLNRSVSFAPDVTLHKFDFIPEIPIKIRVPRRKSMLHPLEPTQLQNETMELTNPVNTEFLENENEGASNSPIYEPVFDKEVSMEITQLFTKHSGTPEPDQIGLLEEANTAEETMELTNMQPTLTLKPAEESMEITKPIGADTLSTEVYVNEEEEEPMDITDQQFIERSLSPITLESLTQKQYDSTMEITNVFELNAGDGKQKPPMLMHSSQFVTSTQNDHPLDGTKTLLEPISSKRRKLDDSGHYSSPLKGQIMYEDNLSDAERLSPIPVPIEYTPDKKPLSDISIRKSPSIIAGDFSNTTIKPSFQDEVAEPIPLKKFLDAAGISFSVDLASIENFVPLDFTFTDDIEAISTAQIYNSLYLHAPILEIYSFITKELYRRVTDSQRLFQELEEQISNNPPPSLFRTYFESSDEAKVSINEQITLIQHFAGMEAKKVWVEWRCQHLRGIKAVLEENLSIVEKEYLEVVKQLTEINSIKQRVKSIEKTLIQEVELLKQGGAIIPSTVGFSEKLKVEKLKRELSKSMATINNMETLQKQHIDITENITKLKTQIAAMKQEIDSLKSAHGRNKAYLDYDVNKIKAIFHQTQLFTGIKFDRLVGSLLQVSLHSNKLKITLDLSKADDLESLKIAYHIPNDAEAHFTKFLLDNLKKRSKNVLSFVKNIQNELLAVKKLNLEFQRLQCILPSKIMKSANGLVLHITDLEVARNTKVIYRLAISDFADIIVKHGKGIITMSAQVVYGNGITQELLERHILAKSRKLLPWFKELRPII